MFRKYMYTIASIILCLMNLQHNRTQYRFVYRPLKIKSTFSCFNEEIKSKYFDYCIYMKPCSKRYGLDKKKPIHFSFSVSFLYKLEPATFVSIKCLIQLKSVKFCI